MKIQVISKETIMPSSATPSPVQTYRFSLLDQLAPPFYVPVVLFYSAPDPEQDFDHVNIYEKLKTSLSECLSCFYPLAGRSKGDEHAVDLGQGAVFVRTRVNARLAKLLANPELKLIVTKRFEFDSASLAALRTKAGDGSTSKSPTLIEAVTALICKAAMNARTEISGNGRSSTVISHVVNLRGRMNPPLPDHSFGNIWRFATATIKEEEDDAELHVLADHLRTAIRKIDDDYVRKLQGEGLRIYERSARTDV
ncbi:stemmadenine O-acetyltransferase [Eucalyptus grandis]|uniref:stemmadenine O-acetyltransferase n=1 Tax=Eucalyptus grandis TaxID=71139 RepID=UPI00192F04A5|nr:stemmadenine O-acetyltransferase [Eucalyptus grandis]